MGSIQQLKRRPKRKPSSCFVLGLLFIPPVLGASRGAAHADAHAVADAQARFTHTRLDRSPFSANGTLRSARGTHSRHNLSGLSAAGKSSLFVGKCQTVVDGDTIVVEHDGQTDKVDLWGIDCPEPNQPYGAQARQYTLNKVLNQPVRVRVKGHTSSGRILGWVDTVGGGTLNEELVGSGLAWWSSKTAKDEVLLPLLEETARADKRGLWADKDPISPARWRKTHGE